MADGADDREILEQARQRCEELIDRLDQEAGELTQPGLAVDESVLADGQAAYDRVTEAAKQLLRRLQGPGPNA